MNRQITPKRLITGLAAIAVIAGGGVALAASNGSSGDKSFFARVAQHLGISTEKLQDATKAAAIDQVDADLKAGRITKAQADELKERIKNGDFPFFGPFQGRRFGPLGEPGFGFRHHIGPIVIHHEAAAEYLGLTGAQLDQKLRSGQTLAEIAKAEGKSVDGLKDAMLADAKKHLDQAVEDDKLTQAQADAMYKRLSADIDDIVNGNFPRFRHPRGMPPFGPRDTTGLWPTAAA
jgi:hypothetical protein